MKFFGERKQSGILQDSKHKSNVEVDVEQRKFTARQLATLNSAKMKR